MPISTAMMPMTTSNSTSVNAVLREADWTCRQRMVFIKAIALNNSTWTEKLIRSGRRQRRQAYGADLGVGQRFPGHLMIDARRADFRKHRGHFGQIVAHPIVIVVVGDLPGGMRVEGHILRRRCVVGRQVL